jgi:hypothetical protein
MTYGWVLALSTLLAACSSTLQVQSVNVPVKDMALFNSQGKKLYLDRLVLPPTKDNNIGIRRTLSGDYWARIKTESDLQAWAAGQWRRFLARHRQIVVANPDHADYYLQCDITRLEVVKQYQWIWDDEFRAYVEMRVAVRDRQSSKTLKTQVLEAQTTQERANDDSARISDDDMLNQCLNRAFQEALEQLNMP